MRNDLELVEAIQTIAENQPSLRQYYAAKAMRALIELKDVIAEVIADTNQDLYKTTAMIAFTYADAMIDYEKQEQINKENK